MVAFSFVCSTLLERLVRLNWNLSIHVIVYLTSFGAINGKIYKVQQNVLLETQAKQFRAVSSTTKISFPFQLFVSLHSYLLLTLSNL